MNTRLEEAALTTARGLEGLCHWDAVCDACRSLTQARPHQIASARADHDALR